MWLDKLGLAATNGISRVLRQCIYGLALGLVDKEVVKPDYWLTFLYKKLVGEDVYEVNVDQSGVDLRLYAGSHRKYERFVNKTTKR